MRILVVLGIILANLLPARTSAASCIFVLGFAALHDLIPATVGACLIDEHHNPTNGDALQETVHGLLVWRKADNWTAFTDGYHTWINGPLGLQERLNTTRFAWEAPSHVGPVDAYPDPLITPGALNPAVTQASIGSTICVSGWTATVRPPESVTYRIKVEQIGEYHLADTSTGDYEEDHFVPLELGGAPSDARNLWPEHYAAPDGARDKDKVENDLHRQVCDGATTLAAAQQAIEGDWVAVYQRLAGATPTPSP